MKTLLSLTTFFCCISITLQAQGFTQGPFQNTILAGPVVADFNGDGFDDVWGYRTQFGERRVRVELNDGNTPISFTTLDTSFLFNVSGASVAVDFDGDQDIDVIGPESTNYHLFLYTNDGTARFSRDSLGISGANNVQAVDLDDDGDIDIVGINSFTTDNLIVYRNEGAQGFTQDILAPGFDGIRELQIADFDGDQKPDIVIGADRFAGDQIVIYRNLGNGAFQATPVVTDDFSGLQDLVVDDLNGDGRQDIIVIKSFTCFAFINQGEMGFQQENLFSVGSFQVSVQTGDYNGDGQTDIIMGGNTGNGVTWQQNLSNDPLQFEEFTVGGVTPAFHLINSDLDKDNDTDLILINGEFWWYENEIDQAPDNVLDFSDTSITLYPNPVVNELRFSNVRSGQYTLSITTVNGQRVLDQQLTANSVDLSHLPTGLYVVTLRDRQSGQSASTSVVKQ